MTHKFVHHVTKKPMPVIAMADVSSSQIKQAGYDPATKTLAMQFKHGILREKAPYQVLLGTP